MRNEKIGGVKGIGRLITIGNGFCAMAVEYHALAYVAFIGDRLHKQERAHMGWWAEVIPRFVVTWPS